MILEALCPEMTTWLSVLQKKDEMLTSSFVDRQQIVKMSASKARRGLVIKRSRFRLVRSSNIAKVVQVEAEAAVAKPTLDAKGVVDGPNADEQYVVRNLHSRAASHITSSEHLMLIRH